MIVITYFNRTWLLLGVLCAIIYGCSAHAQETKDSWLKSIERKIREAPEYQSDTGKEFLPPKPGRSHATGVMLYENTPKEGVPVYLIYLLAPHPEQELHLDCIPDAKTDEKGRWRAFNIFPGEYATLTFCPCKRIAFRYDEMFAVKEGIVANIGQESTKVADGIGGDRRGIAKKVEKLPIPKPGHGHVKGVMLYRHIPKKGIPVYLHRRRSNPNATRMSELLEFSCEPVAWTDEEGYWSARNVKQGCYIVTSHCPNSQFRFDRINLEAVTEGNIADFGEKNTDKTDTLKSKE